MIKTCTCTLLCLWELLSLAPQPTRLLAFVVRKNGIFLLQATVNWMGVEEKGCVYLVSVEVPAGTEEKSYDEDDGDLYANVYMYVRICIRLHMCLHTHVCVVGCCEGNVGA